MKYSPTQIHRKFTWDKGLGVIRKEKMDNALPRLTAGQCEYCGETVTYSIGQRMTWKVRKDKFGAETKIFSHKRCRK